MTWMLTASGTLFDLQFVAEDAIDIDDIAHHLAQINRLTGAAKRPYSVAEHSLLVVEIMERELGITSPHVLLAGLMHDAHEAYTNDVSTPVKAAVGTAWHATEQRIEYHVRKRFALIVSAIVNREAIKRADLIALATERSQLLPPSGPPWPCLATVTPVTWWDWRFSSSLTWTDWKREFLSAFSRLDAARRQHRAHSHEPVTDRRFPPDRRVRRLEPERANTDSPTCPWCDQQIWDHCQSQYDTMTCVQRPLEE